MRLKSILQSLAYPLASAAILSVLLLQVTISVISLPLMKDQQLGRTPTSLRKFVRGPKFWPFVAYPMYAQARFEGDTISTVLVVARFSDGSERPIEPEDLDISFWHFRYFVSAIRNDDRATVKEFLTSYRPWYDQPLDSLRVDLLSLVFNEEGVEFASRRHIKSLTMDPLAANIDAGAPE